jgi:hypothetical protein
MGIDIAKILKKKQELETKQKQNNNDWKPTGKHVIRIIPYKFNKDTPFIELLFHWDTCGVKSMLSPKSFGRPDPIDEFATKLKSGTKADYQLGKSLEPKPRIFVPIIVRGEEDKGVKFWGFGKKVYAQLINIIANPDYGDITDPVSGRDINVEFIPKEDTGTSYPSTAILVKPDRTPITSDDHILKIIGETQKNILDIYKEKTYEEMSELLKNWLNPENKSNGESTETAGNPEVSEVVVAKSVLKESKNVKVAANSEDIKSQFDELFKN